LQLGSYGFLAGKTMEEQGLPNAGLYDQRAVLQWVQDYIYLVGGNKSQVSVWGESAGAGSIMHHLVAQGGTQDPLFSKAVIQSPTLQTMWDRNGYLEEVFQNFSAAADCAGEGLSCLRNASAATLESANYQLNYVETVDGVFLTGPAADGNLIRQLAALEFASGNYWKDLDSLIISHTSSEATLFVDGNIATDAEFSEFLIKTSPSYVQTSGINADIENFYPGVDVNSTYSTETDRVEAYVRDSRITCNTVSHVNSNCLINTDVSSDF
jgi:carboxylesterase type B